MSKSADFGAGACWFGALLSVVTGCASLGPAEQRKARLVLHTERFVQERQVERLSLKAPAVWATAERVSANVEQTWMCRGAYREKVSTTTITSHPTKNVGAETMVGLVLAGAGGVALGISPGLSDVKPNPSDASPRDEAQIFGGLGLGTGVILVGHALWVAVAAAEHESDAVVTEEVRAPEREMKECGREVAGAGVVVAKVGERELELTEVPSGAVDVYLRAHREELCGDPNSGHLFAKLSFVLSSKERLVVPLGAYPLKQCVMATTARRKLRLAETQLAGEVDGRRVAQAVNLVDDADELVEGLSRSDPEKGDLQLEVARLRTVVASKSVGVLAALVDQSVAKIDAGAEDAASSALAALDVARVSKAEAATRGALYGAFGRQGAVRGYAGLAVLVERDRGAKACLQHGEGCSDELPRERWLELLEPLARSVAAATQQSSLKLEAATKELSKSRTGTTLAAFDAATEQAKAAGARCQLPLGAVEAACARLKEAERAAESFAMSQSFELQQLRQRIAEKQRAEQLKKTATRWRRHFAECARLEQGERALQAVGHCDSACEAVVSRMDAERLKLRAFEYSEVVDDASLVSTLREECLAAGCERCP